jgi:hypothetical protein
LFPLHAQTTRTYVRRGALPAGSDQRRGVAQLQVRRDATRGYITFVAPLLSTSDVASDTWVELLEYVGATAGRAGVHHLVAEAPEDGDEVEVLRRAGFVVYLRQDILRLDPARRLAPVTGALRPCEDIDAWPVQQLYFNTAPRLAHLAEGPPQAGRVDGVHGYVYEDEDSLAAYVELRRGPRGAWFSLLVHPNAESLAPQITGQALGQLGPAWDKPIYCGVRRYQEWLRRPLESLGFEPSGSSVLTVKHLVAHVAQPESVLAHAHALEHAKITTPS